MNNLQKQLQERRLPLQLDEIIVFESSKEFRAYKVIHSKLSDENIHLVEVNSMGTRISDKILIKSLFELSPEWRLK